MLILPEVIRAGRLDIKNAGKDLGDNAAVAGVHLSVCPLFFQFGSSLS
jgi:hypothetical protein